MSDIYILDLNSANFIADQEEKIENESKIYSAIFWLWIIDMYQRIAYFEAKGVMSINFRMRMVSERPANLHELSRDETELMDKIAYQFVVQSWLMDSQFAAVFYNVLDQLGLFED